jgi:Arc/MetJ-type ribon-helix-helix transcriptional regulator
MDTTSMRLTERQQDSLDEMVRQKIYPSASEAIRAAVALLEDKHGIHGKSIDQHSAQPKEAPLCQ